MAILSKIREKSIFLIIIIGLALFSFVLSGLFKSSNSIFNGTKSNIGEVNGKPISRRQFATEVDNLKANSQTRITQIQAVKRTWNRLVRQNIYKIQSDNAGIVIGEKEIWEAIISIPTIQNSPIFKNKAGLFDQNKFKEYLATLKESSKNNPNNTRWTSWLATENSLKGSLIENTYNDLVISGLDATLKQAEESYHNKNIKVSAEYALLPYKSIADSLVNISDSEIKNYVSKHKKEFKVEASRDLSYVKFKVQPSKEDYVAVKNKVAKLLNDKEEYSNAAKAKLKVVGFRNTEDNERFFEENNSDTPINNSYLVKTRLSKQIADEVFNGEKGDVFGPYKEKEHYALTKIVDFKQIPDSVKAKHILISYAGASRSSSNRTEAKAKILADSILKVILKDKSKFSIIAKESSGDRGSASKGGNLGWFNYTTMVPSFRDYAFLHKKGDIGIVKSAYGYHIIYIQDQRHFNKAVKLATFTRKVEPSEDTENEIFQNAETFTSNLVSGKNIDSLAKKDKYKVMPVNKIKALDESIRGLQKERTIINWVFNEKREIGDIKRFDLEDSYVVVVLNKKDKKGIESVSQARDKVEPILRNKKKAKMLVEKMKGKSLKDIAKANNIIVRYVISASLASPIGNNYDESGVFGAMVASKVDVLQKGVIGNKGVYAFKVSKKDTPAKVDNYNTLRSSLQNELINQKSLIYPALKDASTINDYRALFY